MEKPLQSRFSLKRLQESIPEMVADVQMYRHTNVVGKKVFIFATMHFWIEHAAVMGLAMAGPGT